MKLTYAVGYGPYPGSPPALSTGCFSAQSYQAQCQQYEDVPKVPLGTSTIATVIYGLTTGIGPTPVPGLSTRRIQHGTAQLWALLPPVMSSFGVGGRAWGGQNWARGGVEWAWAGVRTSSGLYRWILSSLLGHVVQHGVAQGCNQECWCFRTGHNLRINLQCPVLHFIMQGFLLQKVQHSEDVILAKSHWA